MSKLATEKESAWKGVGKQKQQKQRNTRETAGNAKHQTTTTKDTIYCNYLNAGGGGLDCNEGNGSNAETQAHGKKYGAVVNITNVTERREREKGISETDIFFDII